MTPPAQSPAPVGLVDLRRQRRALEPGLGAALARVLDHGAFVNGPEVAEFESRLAARLGVGHAVGCGSGTDALHLLLRAAGIGPGDAVIVPALTFAATAEAVAVAGATPVFADVRPADSTLCPDSAARALAALRAEGGPRPRAVMPVDLFSLPADTAALADLCRAEGLRLFHDAAHSVGTDTALGPCGALGDGAATSFYASKALGGFGEGGAAMTDDADLAAAMRSLRNHGIEDGGHARIGLNARLDTLQAAVLLEKLRLFDAETARRREIAARYRAELAGVCDLPEPPPGCAPVWSYFAVTHPRRDALEAHLAERGVGSVAYHARPTHLHPAYRGFPTVPGGLPITERIAGRLLCLPLHPYLTDDEVARVIEGVRSLPSEGAGARLAAG